LGGKKTGGDLSLQHLESRTGGKEGRKITVSAYDTYGKKRRETHRGREGGLQKGKLEGITKADNHSEVQRKTGERSQICGRRKRRSADTRKPRRGKGDSNPKRKRMTRRC